MRAARAWLAGIVLWAAPGVAAAADMVGPITLHGCPSGDYWVVAAVGSQRFHLLLDSGSTTLAVAGHRCHNCLHATGSYVPHATAHDEHQSADAAYGDGSGWHGEVYTDTVALPGMRAAVRMRIVAMQREKDFFTEDPCGSATTPDSPYQGILGMGPQALAVEHTDGLVAVLGARAEQPLYSFSTALCDQGGRLWLGNFDARIATGPTQFTAMDPNSPFYAITLADLQVGGSSLGHDAAEYGPAVVDTGTSDFVLPAAIATNLTALLESDPTFQAELAGNASGFFQSGACNPASSMTRAQLDAHLPQLGLTLPATHGGTVTLALDATRSYLTVLERDGHTLYCPAVAGGDDGQTILGSAVMRSHIVTFDAHGGQVGFTPHKACVSHQG